MDITVSNFKKSDKEQMSRLQKEFFLYNRKEVLSKKIKGFEKIEDIDKLIDDELKKYIRKICFVAEEGGELKGFIEGEVKLKKWKVYNKQGWVNEFFVTKQHRSRGIGMMLFNRLIEEFKRKGCNALIVGAYVDNSKSIALYRKLGFIERNLGFIRKI